MRSSPKSGSYKYSYSRPMTRGIDVTVAAIIERDGKFLMVEERSAGNLVLNQPAGHLEQGESLLAAVTREALEETGHRFEPEDDRRLLSLAQPGRGHHVSARRVLRRRSSPRPTSRRWTTASSPCTGSRARSSSAARTSCAARWSCAASTTISQAIATRSTAWPISTRAPRISTSAPSAELSPTSRLRCRHALEPI